MTTTIQGAIFANQPLARKDELRDALSLAISALELAAINAITHEALVERLNRAKAVYARCVPHGVYETRTVELGLMRRMSAEDLAAGDLPMLAVTRGGKHGLVAFGDGNTELAII